MSGNKGAPMKSGDFMGRGGAAERLSPGTGAGANGYGACADDDIGARLLEARERAGMTQVEASKLSGMGVSLISELEHGDHMPSAKSLWRLARCYGVSADWLLGGDDPGHMAPARSPATEEITLTGLGNRLMEARVRAGLSQEQAAAKAGTTKNNISKREQGEYMPQVEILRKLAKCYGVTVDHLLGLDRPGEPPAEPVEAQEHEEEAPAVKAKPAAAPAEEHRVNKKQCRGCRYWHYSAGLGICCNYLLDTGRSRLAAQRSSGGKECPCRIARADKPRRKPKPVQGPLGYRGRGG